MTSHETLALCEDAHNKSMALAFSKADKAGTTSLFTVRSVHFQDLLLIRLARAYMKTQVFIDKFTTYMTYLAWQ